MFVWKFIIPLSVFVTAFTKILSVIRRQAKVMPTNRRKITVKPMDVSTVAPTKTVTVIGSIFDGRCITELSMGPFCVARSNPTHQLTDPTRPKTIQLTNLTAWCKQISSNRALNALK